MSEFHVPGTQLEPYHLKLSSPSHQCVTHPLHSSSTWHVSLIYSCTDPCVVECNWIILSAMLIQLCESISMGLLLYHLPLSSPSTSRLTFPLLADNLATIFPLCLHDWYDMQRHLFYNQQGMFQSTRWGSELLKYQRLSSDHSQLPTLNFIKSVSDGSHQENKSFTPLDAHLSRNKQFSSTYPTSKEPKRHFQTPQGCQAH